jgi:hypothetical protein
MLDRTRQIMRRMLCEGGPFGPGHVWAYNNGESTYVDDVPDGHDYEALEYLVSSYGEHEEEKMSALRRAAHSGDISREEFVEIMGDTGARLWDQYKMPPGKVTDDGWPFDLMGWALDEGYVRGRAAEWEIGESSWIEDGIQAAKDAMVDENMDDEHDITVYLILKEGRQRGGDASWSVGAPQWRGTVGQFKETVVNREDLESGGPSQQPGIGDDPFGIRSRMRRNIGGR